MKKILFAAMAAIVLLASCSKNNENPGGATGEKAKLNISVTAPVLSRATGATVATDAVDNFSVFVTGQTGEIKYKAHSSTGGNLTGAAAVTVDIQAQHVYVVANAGDLTTTITTMAELNAYLADLNETGTGSQAAARWATGKSDVLSFSPNGDDYVATADVALTFIAARITLKIENGMTGYDANAIDGSLVLKNVAVLNARGQSKLFGTSLIPDSYDPGKKFYTGINPIPPFSTFPATADYTYNVATALLLSDLIPANDFDQTYYYYVFENDAVTIETFPTIITLVGEFDNKPVYYPIHLAPYEQWLAGSGVVRTLERGKSYDINVKLTVDPAVGGGGVDPTDPVITTSVEISVTLNSWIPIGLGKEFE